MSLILLSSHDRNDHDPDEATTRPVDGTNIGLSSLQTEGMDAQLLSPSFRAMRSGEVHAAIFLQDLAATEKHRAKGDLKDRAYMPIATPGLDSVVSNTNKH